MPRSVLIVDDTETMRQRLGQVLTATELFSRILTANDGISGFKLLLEEQVDLILCDLVMPRIDGYKFLSLIRSRPEYAEVPVIMLTGAEDVRSKVRGLSAGASDYLTKPFHDEELVARVKVHLKVKALQDELRERNARLEKLSRTDALTGLSNRRHFMDTLRTELLRAKRYTLPLVFAMVDVDHFKKVNDRYGHPAGDRALALVAKTLRDTMRLHDVVGRYGGEEFAIIMPHTDLKGGIRAIERFRRHVEQTRVTLDDGTKLSLTVSAGVACFQGESPQTEEDLIKAADAALYTAKEQGRNRIIVAE